MKFVSPAEGFPESRIDTLHPLLLNLPDLCAVTAQCELPAEVDRYLTDVSIHFNKPDARAERAGFLPYIAYFPGTKPRKRLKAQAKRDILGIAECHREQNLHRLCRNVPERPVMVFNAGRLERRDRPLHHFSFPGHHRSFRIKICFSDLHESAILR